MLRCSSEGGLGGVVLGWKGPQLLITIQCKACWAAASHHCFLCPKHQQNLTYSVAQPDMFQKVQQNCANLFRTAPRLVFGPPFCYTYAELHLLWLAPTALFPRMYVTEHYPLTMHIMSSDSRLAPTGCH